VLIIRIWSTRVKQVLPASRTAFFRKTPQKMRGSSTFRFVRSPGRRKSGGQRRVPARVPRLVRGQYETDWSVTAQALAQTIRDLGAAGIVFTLILQEDEPPIKYLRPDKLERSSLIVDIHWLLSCLSENDGKDHEP